VWLLHVVEEALLFSGLKPCESLILFEYTIQRGKNTMYLESGAQAQKENLRGSSREQHLAKKGIEFLVRIGDAVKCPECDTMGRVVWVSDDQKRMGVRCHASHRETIKPNFKYGATKVVSTKTKRNVVFLTAIR
jgi:hypothetical protein